MRIIIAIPAFNEERIITETLRSLQHFMRENFAHDDYSVVVSDNASTDTTVEKAQTMAEKDKHILYFHVNQKGKGIAVLSAWKHFPADVYCFMDADMATDIVSLPALIAAVKNGHDIAVGSRFLPESLVDRTLFRQIVSRGYSLFIRSIIGTRIKDLPCGFKAVNARVVHELIDSVENKTWFFDSELVLRAEHAGYSIAEIAVSWSEKNDAVRASRVRFWGLPVFIEYMRNAWRLKKQLR